jgi:PilZ domain
MPKEKRFLEREPVLIEVEPKGPLSGRKYRLRNISLGGFSLETDHQMAEGERFDFSFRLPEDQDIFTLSGRVVWVKQVSANPEKYYIGLAFLANLDKLPTVFPLLLNRLEEEEFAKIHFSAVAVS